MRIGYGYDLHRFRARGGVLKLGGVAMPWPRGLQGHSDADVLLHAIADALLGAIAAPDLGELFPPSNPALRDADSRLFVREALMRVTRAGWRVVNVDAIVVADAPRLSPQKAQLRASIAALLGVGVGAVSVKGKTTEGFSPGAEGIAAHAMVLLEAADRPPGRGAVARTSTRRSAATRPSRRRNVKRTR